MARPLPAAAALLAGIASLASVAAIATPRPRQASAHFDEGRAFEHLRQLVAIGPRPSGSPALRAARAYITRALSEAGLVVQEQPFTATTPAGPIDMVNLVATLPGRRPDRILLTGHYDTKRSSSFPFVGASDGASSAAILIELARVLKGTPHEFTYDFVWFDGEEATCWDWDQCSRPDAPDHLYGSRHFVDAARAAHALPIIKALLLFDMIGARDLEIRRETGFSTPWLTDLVWATAKRLGFGTVFLDSGTGAVDDDHLPFSQAGVPTIDLIDLADYPQWHTAQDDLAHVGARSLGIVGHVTLAALPAIEQTLAR